MGSFLSQPLLPMCKPGTYDTPEVNRIWDMWRYYHVFGEFHILPTLGQLETLNLNG